jgi:Pyruvate/2-oxoacid:ferredoxin oxidoreductase delta subunit
MPKGVVMAKRSARRGRSQRRLDGAPESEGVVGGRAAIWMRSETPWNSWWNEMAAASDLKVGPRGEREGKSNDKRVEHDAELQNLCMLCFCFCLTNIVGGKREMLNVGYCVRGCQLSALSSLSPVPQHLLRISSPLRCRNPDG